MTKEVIRVENISKLYRLGEVGTGTLSHDLNRWWAKLRGKEDPFAKVARVNERSGKSNSRHDYVWALKDIDFSVEPGEVLGIIGRNGAGKSTLLKIISRITAPTQGNIKVKGRIGSLLEVGTGFHPEMTGRENIFMNGTLLGMRRREIQNKLEEIVEFAGVALYLDTPVKRYSSGMMVRLGFAVAAFLEPEILIVDEVLSVGDAEFQKKALGRMQDVSKNDGRTVLFVSHNMAAVEVLCTRAILINSGQIQEVGKTDAIIKHYLTNKTDTFKPEAKLQERNFFQTISLLNNGMMKTDTFAHSEKIGIETKLEINDWHPDLELAISIKNASQNRLFTKNILLNQFMSNSGKLTLRVFFNENFLMAGNYSWMMYINKPRVIAFDIQDGILPFKVIDTGSTYYKYGVKMGDVFPPTSEVTKV